MKDKKKLTAKEIWSFIESLGWAEASSSGEYSETSGFIDKSKIFMLANIGSDDMGDIRKFIDSRYFELNQAIDAYERKNNIRCGGYGGDDSFGDMIHHAIGYGEDTFNQVVNNPNILNMNPDLGENFVESFSYCFPYDGDYISCNHTSIKDEAMEALGRLRDDRYSLLKNVLYVSGSLKKDEDDTFSHIVDLIKRMNINISDIPGYSEMEELEGRLLGVMADDPDVALGGVDLDNDDYMRLYKFEGNQNHALYVNLLKSYREYILVQDMKNDTNESIELTM